MEATLGTVVSLLIFIWKSGNCHKSWIRPVLENGSILYSGAALTHLNRLDRFQARAENMCGFTFPFLTNRHNVSILGITCRPLAGEGHSNLLS